MTTDELYITNEELSTLLSQLEPILVEFTKRHYKEKYTLHFPFGTITIEI